MSQDRSQQFHYFSKLFSRWRSESGSSSPRQNQNDQEMNRGESNSGLLSKFQQTFKDRPPSSYSFPETDITPHTVRRTRWKLDSKKPREKQSLDTALSSYRNQPSDRSIDFDRSKFERSIDHDRSRSDRSIESPDHRTANLQSCFWRSPELRNQKQQQQPCSVEYGATREISNIESHNFENLEKDLPESTVISEVSKTNVHHGFMDVRLPKFQLKKLRYKQQSFVDQAVWKPTENCCWKNTTGVCIRLRGAHLERLAAVERQTLQKVALTHLQKANLGCAILRPKDSLLLRQKRHKYIKRKAHTVNVVDKKDGAATTSSTQYTSARKSPSSHSSVQQVFGIPLSQCIENEQQWEWEQQELASSNVTTTTTTINLSPSNNQLQQQQRQQPIQNETHIRTHQQALPSTSSSSSGIGTSGSGGLVSQYPINKNIQLLSDEQKQRCQSLDLDEVEFLRVARTSPQRLSGESSKSSLSDQASSDSLLIRPGYSKSSLNNQTFADDTPSSERRYASSDSLLGYLSCQYSPRYTTTPTYGLPKQDSCEPHFPRVPKVVQACTDYLSQKGLQTIGIFRIAGSAKRCRQLRLELDSGQEVVLNEEQPEIYPHDIATLLKEYFRDLPDPLLTKELYAPFVACAKFPEEMRVELLRYLIALLPLANCDTLLVLLQFLRRVAKHSYDTINDQGISLSGNKMNAHNLATVFGPTILRQATGKLTQTWTENEAVIRVMETMIERCDDLFTIPPTLQDSLYRSLCETDADSLDHILNRLANESERPLDEQEETQTAVYFSSQDELDPPYVAKDNDGTTVIKTRQTTTHRIVYKIHKPTGRILGSSRFEESLPSSPSVSSDFSSKVAALVNEKFPELSLFTEEDDESSVGGARSCVEEASDFIDLTSANTAAVLVGSPSTSRALALSGRAKAPIRKLTPLAKLTEAIRPNSAKK